MKKIKYFDGHKGTYYFNSIYKLEEPYQSTILGVFKNKGLNDFAILYEHIRDLEYGDAVILVKYFTQGYNTRWNMFENKFDNNRFEKELKYLEPIEEDIIEVH